MHLQFMFHRDETYFFCLTEADLTGVYPVKFCYADPPGDLTGVYPVKFMSMTAQRI